MLLPLLAFTDVCYVAYLNSFYMDAAGLCALLLMAASAVWLLEAAPERIAPLCLFAAAALLFVTSKTQHAVWLILPVALLIARGAQARARARRALAWSLAAVVLFSGGAMLASTDASYRGQAMFNVVFFRLAPAGFDLAPLGVKPEELQYRGMHSFTPGAPAADSVWSQEFYRRTGLARLLWWYARHPGATLGFLAETLREGAPEMRPVNLSNFRREDGRPPGARTQRFAVWSTLRSRLSSLWPAHLALWYVLFLAGCLRSRSTVRWLAMGVAVLGAGEFTAGALGDSLDAGRHLFLFQAATDLTLCFAAAALIGAATVRERFLDTIVNL
jgi:hypothetical protein